MAIILKDGAVPSGPRTKLIDHLPLDTPYMVEVFPIYACNLRCKYCMISTDKKEHGYLTAKTMLLYADFVSLVNDLRMFHRKLKVLRFAGLGEPLLHKQLVDMVGYACENKIADQIETLTNGTLFDGYIENQLASAGVTRFIVSIQGTTVKRYREVCGRSFDPSSIAFNLHRLKQECPWTEIYVKTVDTSLTHEDDGNTFYLMFGDSCDKISIEHTVPIHPTVDYSDKLSESTKGKTQFGSDSHRVHICPRPFMSLHVIPDGNVIPCYSLEYPVILGNIQETSLKKIWGGEALRQFRCKMINLGRDCNPVCKDCKIIDHRAFEEENLDEHRELLKERFGL